MRDCTGHHELRALAEVALDRLEPLVERLRTEGVTPAQPTCTACPVCVVLATLRGERPEVAVRLAEHAGGLLTLLRAALAETPPRAEPSPPARRVQRIPVTRA